MEGITGCVFLKVLHPSSTLPVLLTVIKKHTKIKDNLPTV